MQMQTNSEHAKVMFQVQICTERLMRNYIKFDDKQAENHVLRIASLGLVDLVCLRDRSIIRLGLALGVVYTQSVGGVHAM